MVVEVIRVQYHVRITVDSINAFCGGDSSIFILRAASVTRFCH